MYANNQIHLPHVIPLLNANEVRNQFNYMMDGLRHQNAARLGIYHTALHVESKLIHFYGNLPNYLTFQKIRNAVAMILHRINLLNAQNYTIREIMEDNHYVRIISSYGHIVAQDYDPVRFDIVPFDEQMMFMNITCIVLRNIHENAPVDEILIH